MAKVSWRGWALAHRKTGTLVMSGVGVSTGPVLFKTKREAQNTLDWDTYAAQPFTHEVVRVQVRAVQRQVTSRE